MARLFQTVPCEWCGRIFTRDAHRFKYCSSKCFSESRREKHREAQVRSRIVEVIEDPDEKAGFPDGAVLQRVEFNEMLKQGYLTTGMRVKYCNAVYTVSGEPYCEQKLVI